MRKKKLAIYNKKLRFLHISCRILTDGGGGLEEYKNMVRAMIRLWKTWKRTLKMTMIGS